MKKWFFNIVWVGRVRLQRFIWDLRGKYTLAENIHEAWKRNEALAKGVLFSLLGALLSYWFGIWPTVFLCISVFSMFVLQAMGMMNLPEPLDVRRGHSYIISVYKEETSDILNPDTGQCYGESTSFNHVTCRVDVGGYISPNISDIVEAVLQRHKSHWLDTKDLYILVANMNGQEIYRGYLDAMILDERVRLDHTSWNYARYRRIQHESDDKRGIVFLSSSS